uniref:Uncharacterized protein n=1 Tax=Arundo donax TaxID=35708 RepID=A0A0A9FQY7_ARUDO
MVWQNSWAYTTRSVTLKLLLIEIVAILSLVAFSLVLAEYSAG